MRPPAEIKPRMSARRLMTWVRDAPTAAVYQRRLVIWLAAGRRFHAEEIAEMVQGSPRSVRRWIHVYNERGPRGLDEDGRGGRRWGYATPEEERRLLSPLHDRAAKAELLTADQIRSEVEQALGHPVSLSYVYQLLGRHDWRKLVPRPRHRKADLIEQIIYKSELPRPASQPVFRGARRAASSGAVP
jgi:transposase